MGIYAKSLQSFRRRLENRGRFDYFALCELWAEHLGRENILARVYDPERPIVEHFFETLGIACPDRSEPKFVHSNRSVDARLIGALRAVIQLRENGFAVDVCDRLLSAIRHYDTELPKQAGASRYVLMNAKDRADLLRNCEAGNQLLSDRYLQGNQFPRIDSSADEIKVSDRFILPELFKELVKLAAGSHIKTEDTGCGSVRDDGGPQVLCASGGTDCRFLRRDH
jgi:hypothetical protein